MGGCWDTENESLNNWEMLLLSLTIIRRPDMVERIGSYLGTSFPLFHAGQGHGMQGLTSVCRCSAGRTTSPPTSAPTQARSRTSAPPAPTAPAGGTWSPGRSGRRREWCENESFPILFSKIKISHISGCLKVAPVAESFVFTFSQECFCKSENGKYYRGRGQFANC